MQQSFHTPRLNLQPLTADDHEFIKELVNTAGWLKFIGDRNIHSETAAREYIQKILTTPGFAYWVVRLKDAGTSIGVVTLLKRDYLDNQDIGFAFLPAYQQQGFAFEAVQKVLHEKVKKEASVILATTLPSNTSSIKLLEKLGFQFREEIKPADETLHLYEASVKDLPG